MNARADTGAGRPVRILLADPQPLLRTGFRTVLGAEDDLDVVGEAGDGTQAVELARRLLPDVVLTEVRLPRLDGLAVTRCIVGSGLPVRVLVVTDADPDEYTAAAVQAGATGLIGKHAPPGQLTAAVRAVATGTAVLAPEVLRHLVNRGADQPASTRPATPDLVDALTARERQVLAQVARGLTNAEIARALTVSETTVKTHVGHVLTKLGLRDRVQAVVLAYESGLVRPGRP